MAAFFVIHAVARSKQFWINVKLTDVVKNTGQRQSLLTQNIDTAESRWLELHEQLEALEEE